MPKTPPQSDLPKSALRPGDEAPEGTPGTGEALCPVCRGSGRADDRACGNCAGTGKIIKAIGGA
jgi:hypothetical protein